MESESKKPRNPVVIGVISVAVVALLLFAVTTLASPDANETAQVTSNAQATPTASPSPALSPGAAAGANTASPAPAAGAYTAGSYTASGSYNTPGGKETIAITVTLDANGAIKESSANANAESPTSKEYQTKFINNYQSQVIGKDIASLNLSKVSGSSLTPKGFNDALNQIKQKARA